MTCAQTIKNSVRVSDSTNQKIESRIHYKRMKSFFGYIRVSTQKQGQTGVSLQEQRAAIERYAERHQLTIARWFEERETAAKRGRPIFTTMLKLLKQRKAGGIIIHKIDRSARNLRDWADLGELIDAGVELHFATESLDLNTRGGRLSADIQAVVAADFIRNLREETRKGFYGRLKQGVYPLPAPIGYVDRGAGKPKEPNNTTAPLIRQAFEMYATGNYTLRTLREELRRRGLRNKNGKVVSVNGLSAILNNPFYYGLMRIHKTNETFKGGHQPIVSRRLFQQVQDVLSGRTQRKVQKHPFVFRRLLRCAVCGYTLIAEKQKGHIYYRCHTKGCPVTGIRHETVEDEIATIFARAQLSPEEVNEVRMLIPVVLAEQAESAEERIETAQLQLANLKVRMDRLVDAYIDQIIDKAVFEERKQRLTAEEITLEENVENIRSVRTAKHERIEKILELAGSLYVAFISADDEQKRNLLNQATSNRLVGPKKLEITLYSPFQEMAKRPPVPCGAPYRDEPRTFAEQIIGFADAFGEQAETSGQSQDMSFKLAA